MRQGAVKFWNLPAGCSAAAALAVKAMGVIGVLLVAGQPVAAQEVQLPDNFVSPEMPADLSPDGQPAYTADLEQAAIFAWQEFIALNWPAASGQREIAAPTAFDARPDEPKVWETMRGRVEVYPGHGEPNGFDRAAPDYGYSVPPDYIYSPKAVGTADGRITACAQNGGDAPPWHNLDEDSNQNVMSGLSPQTPYPGQNILVESKVNRPGYVYVAARGWYGENSIRMAARRTGKYIRTHFQPPRPASRADDPEDTQYVSFPNDTMELKAAWRRLGRYDRPARFHRSQVRYYAGKDGEFCYIDSSATAEGDDVWGLLAMHITRKTPSAPYFIWATFEQVDNLVADTAGPDGKAVSIEAADGSPAAGVTLPEEAYSPPLKLTAATPDGDQEYVPASMTPAADPKLRLHYYQEPVYEIPEVRYVAVNRRLYATPEAIRAVNRAAQQAIRKAAPDSALQHYRLVAVQWRPLDKPPGKAYTGPESAAVYYAANVAIEAPPVHQRFSGQFSHGFSKASDYLQRELLFLNPPPNPGKPVFFNTYHAGQKYLAGGCMGCHGQRQSYGTDWSFLLFRQRVEAPVLPDH